MSCPPSPYSDEEKAVSARWQWCQRATTLDKERLSKRECYRQYADRPDVTGVLPPNVIGIGMAWHGMAWHRHISEQNRRDKFPRSRTQNTLAQCTAHRPKGNREVHLQAGPYRGERELGPLAPAVLHKPIVWLVL